MKLLLFVDVHSSKKYLDEVMKKGRNADLLICLGDISMFQSKLKTLLNTLNTIGKTVLMLPGNHELEEDLDKACDKFENIIYLHKNHIEIDDYLFLAYGSGGFITHDIRFEEQAKKWEKIISKDKKIIFLTHGPPYGVSVDKIGKSHVGNKSFTKFIKKHQPVLAACGHLHENFNKVDKIGKTIVLNPGPEGKIFIV